MITMMRLMNMKWIPSRNQRKLRTLYINFQDDIS